MPKKGESDPVKEKFWRRQLADFESNGMTLRDFCRSRGLSDKNFANWRKRLALKDAASREAAATKSDFAPVQMVDSDAAEPAIRSGSEFPMEVVLRNGVILRLAEDCSMNLLASVFSLVGVK